MLNTATNQSDWQNLVIKFTRDSNRLSSDIVARKTVLSQEKSWHGNVLRFLLNFCLESRQMNNRYQKMF